MKDEQLLKDKPENCSFLQGYKTINTVTAIFLNASKHTLLRSRMYQKDTGHTLKCKRNESESNEKKTEKKKDARA